MSWGPFEYPRLPWGTPRDSDARPTGTEGSLEYPYRTRQRVATQRDVLQRCLRRCLQQCCSVATLFATCRAAAQQPAVRLRTLALQQRTQSGAERYSQPYNLGVAPARAALRGLQPV